MPCIDYSRSIKNNGTTVRANDTLQTADGGLPKDLWETVSAFANTDGGYIVLGVSESKGRLVISGVRNPNGAQKNFWDIHNNPQKLNAPICSNSNVQVLKVDGHSLVTIWVSRAARTQRPVYISNNPMTGTYKRNYEGDYRCTQEEVWQMLRDASKDSQDFQILEGFDLTDLVSNKVLFDKRLVPACHARYVNAA